ncbi:MAG: hypothetical protein HQL28_03195 [Candidatus Omnitrophica bacterium]|nr:hypothetical protein [Candidatus Omnitrophota bacterium]
MGKGILIVIAAVFAGFVGYKILEKKNPGLIKKINKSVSDAGKKVSDVMEEAKTSFQEGYVNG